MLAQGQKGTLIVYPEPLDYEKSWVHFSPIPETDLVPDLRDAAP
jgi:hypothetical protein